MADCGWTGTEPKRTQEVALLARIVTGIKVKRLTKALRDLQQSGDLIVVKDGLTMEVIA
ncbi:MAG TPA: hypothetical protein VIV15_07935 [Anaerolineales bacterium]